MSALLLRVLRPPVHGLRRFSPPFFIFLFFIYIHCIILRAILRMHPLGYGAIFLYT